MSSWLVAMLPMLGLIVGATLQHVFSRTQESRKQRDGLRTSAYVDYLRGVTMTALAQQRADDESEAAGNALMADAKARMCVYGGTETLSALAAFSKGGAALATREGVESFVSLCETMRAETGEPAIRREDLVPVLFARSLAEIPPKQSGPTPALGSDEPIALPRLERKP